MSVLATWRPFVVAGACALVACGFSLIRGLGAEVPGAATGVLSRDVSWLDLPVEAAEPAAPGYAAWSPRRERWGRSPFLNALDAERVGPEMARLHGSSAIAPVASGPSLTAVFRIDGKPVALMSGEVVTVGDRVGSVQVVEIGEQSVRIREGSRERWLRMASADQR